MRLTYILFLIFSLNLLAQDKARNETKYTHQDSLRGTITPERMWWDLTHYELDVTVRPESKTIFGKNTIQYKTLDPNNNVMQIDLQPPMQLTKAIQDGQELSIVHNGNAHFIALEKSTQLNAIDSIAVHFEGKPKEAIRAPWDGGFRGKKMNMERIL